MKRIAVALASFSLTVAAYAAYVGVMADTTTGVVALPALEARIAKWAAITGKPTTVDGYGITDAATESWVVQYVADNTTPMDMTNEPAFKGWTNIWHDLITNHLNATASNPHGITPAMIGAATTGELAQATAEYATTGMIASAYLPLSNCVWTIQQSCSEFSVMHGTNLVMMMSYNLNESPTILSMAVSTNPEPTLTFTFLTVGTTNRLETAAAPTNGATADWQTWDLCSWSYAGTTGTVVATGVDLDVPTWARIVSLSGAVNTNAFVLFGAQPYYGSAEPGNQLVTRSQISAIDPALLDAKLSSRRTFVHGALVVTTNSETGLVETNYNMTPGPAYDGWYFDEETGDVTIKHLATSNMASSNITANHIAKINGGLTNDVAISVTLDSTTYYADADGNIDLGTIGGADNTTMVTGLSIRVGTDVNNPGTNTMVVGERSGATSRNGIALGYRASAIHSNAFVWSDGSADVAFNSRTDNTFNVRAEGGAFFQAPAIYLASFDGTNWTYVRLATTNDTSAGGIDAATAGLIATNVASAGYLPLQNAGMWNFDSSEGVQFLGSADGYTIDFVNGTFVGAWGFTNGVAIGGVQMQTGIVAVAFNGTTNAPNAQGVIDIGTSADAATSNLAARLRSGLRAPVPAVFADGQATIHPQSNAVWGLDVGQAPCTNVSVDVSVAEPGDAIVVLLEVKRGTNEWGWGGLQFLGQTNAVPTNSATPFLLYRTAYSSNFTVW